MGNNLVSHIRLVSTMTEDTIAFIGFVVLVLICLLILYQRFHKIKSNLFEDKNESNPPLVSDLVEDFARFGFECHVVEDVESEEVHPINSVKYLGFFYTMYDIRNYISTKSLDAADYIGAVFSLEHWGKLRYFQIINSRTLKEILIEKE